VLLIQDLCSRFLSETALGSCDTNKVSGSNCPNTSIAFAVMRVQEAAQSVFSGADAYGAESLQSLFDRSQII